MRFLKNRHPKRLLKFSLVGSMNSLVDFFVLNLLSYLTGFNKGIFAAIFSAIASLTANVNSYHFNKKWTFKTHDKKTSFKRFIIVGAFGASINIVVVYFLTTAVHQTYYSDIIWLNVSKIIATFFVMLFNYYGYKKYVFKC